MGASRRGDKRRTKRPLRMSATDAARRFSDVINRVYYRRETILVERGGKAVCQIAPAAPPSFTLEELGPLIAELPRPDPSFFDELEASLRIQPSIAGSPWER